MAGRRKNEVSGGQDQLEGSGSEDQNEGLWEPHPT